MPFPTARKSDQAIVASVVGDRRDVLNRIAKRLLTLDRDAGKRLTGILISDNALDRPRWSRHMDEGWGVDRDLIAASGFLVRWKPNDLPGLGAGLDLNGLDRRPIKVQLDDPLATDAFDTEPTVNACSHEWKHRRADRGPDTSRQEVSADVVNPTRLLDSREPRESDLLLALPYLLYVD